MVVQRIKQRHFLVGKIKLNLRFLALLCRHVGLPRILRRIRNSRLFYASDSVPVSLC